MLNSYEKNIVSMDIHRCVGSNVNTFSVVLDQRKSSGQSLFSTDHLHDVVEEPSTLSVDGPEF